MNLRFDPAVDALYIDLSKSPVVESEEVASGIILDFDADEKVVGIEILRVSRRGALEESAVIATTVS